jgi:hypothetical protein
MQSCIEKLAAACEICESNLPPKIVPTMAGGRFGLRKNTHGLRRFRRS